MNRWSTSLLNANQNYNDLLPYSGQNRHRQKKSANNEYWRAYGEKGTLLYWWCEYKLVQRLWRTVWRFLKKLNIELLYDGVIPHIPGLLSRENPNSKGFMRPNVHWSNVYKAKTWKQPQCPSTVTDKQVVHVKHGILLNHEKEWNNTITATWMDL